MGLRSCYYQFNKNSYSNGLIDLQKRVTTSQKFTKESQKLNKIHDNTKENYQTTKGRRKEQRGNTKSTAKISSKWQ